MAKFDVIKMFAPEILEAKEVIKFETGSVRYDVYCVRAIRVTLKNINDVILKQTYIFADLNDWFEMIDELLMLTPVFEKDTFYEKEKVKYTKNF